MYQLGRTVGFTLIELLVVMVLISILAVISFQGFLNYANEQQFDANVVEVRSQLKEARTSTLAAEGNQRYGVAFGQSTTTVFVGQTYVPGDPENELTEFNWLTITPDLTDGATSVSFTRLTGVPSATGTLLFTNTRSGATSTVTIYGTGIIE